MGTAIRATMRRTGTTTAEAIEVANTTEVRLGTGTGTMNGATDLDTWDQDPVFASSHRSTTATDEQWAAASKRATALELSR